MKTLNEQFEYVSEVKKSRFIAKVFPIADPAEAKQHIDSYSDPAATHNCWAYRIGAVYRFSDDGEPGGTAGRPILAAIEKQDIDQCLVLVTRFFGGIKLGAGGLVRAYGGAAATCLRLAPTKEMIPTVHLKVAIPFDAVSDIHNLLKLQHATKLNETYEPSGVVLDIEVESGKRIDFETQVGNMTRGQGSVTEVD